MLFSNTHFAMGVHVLTALAANEGPVPSADLAHGMNTNAAFLRQVLGQLKRAGLVETKLGAGGGAMLARSAQTIRLSEVFRATVGRAEVKRHDCPQDGRCHVADAMNPFFDELSSRLDEAIDAELGDWTIADVLARA